MCAFMNRVLVFEYFKEYSIMLKSVIKINCDQIGLVECRIKPFTMKIRQWLTHTHIFNHCLTVVLPLRMWLT